MKSMPPLACKTGPVRDGLMGPRAVALLVFLLIALNGSAAIYLKIEDIPGESKAAGRERWIDILSLGASVDHGKNALGEVMNTGELVLRKRLDKSSPDLLLAALRQTRIPEVLIEVEENGLLEICYRLKGARLVRHELESAAAEDELSERFHLRFDVGEWHDFQYGRQQQEHVGTTWNFATNQGGVLDDHSGNAPLIAPIPPREVLPGERFEVRVDLIDPNQNPDRLELSAFTADGARIKILGLAGEGSRRILTVEAGSLENGPGEVLLTVSDGTRSTTQVLPVLIGGPRTAYQSYLEGYLGNRAADHPDLLRPLRDPDSDGLTNLMEFYLGTNPAQPTRRNEAFSLTRERNENGSFVTLRYFRRTDQKGLFERFEGTFNLGQWETLGPQSTPPVQVRELGPSANGYVPMEATIPLGPDDASFFMRLSVRGSL